MMLQTPVLQEKSSLTLTLTLTSSLKRECAEACGGNNAGPYVTMRVQIEGWRTDKDVESVRVGELGMDNGELRIGNDCVN